MQSSILKRTQQEIKKESCVKGDRFNVHFIIKPTLCQSRSRQRDIDQVPGFPLRRRWPHRLHPWPAAWRPRHRWCGPQGLYTQLWEKISRFRDHQSGLLKGTGRGLEEDFFKFLELDTKVDGLVLTWKDQPSPSYWGASCSPQRLCTPEAGPRWQNRVRHRQTLPLGCNKE